MNKFSQKVSAVAALALGVLALSTPTAKAQTAYVLGGGGLTLLSFDLGSPGTVNSVALSGGLEAIDFRPATGQLYGYSDVNDALYTVDPATGALTQVAASTGAGNTNGTAYGLDFNPTIDRVRVVNDSSDLSPNNANNNLVYNPTAPGSTPTIATELIYADGDVSAGLVPAIGENAYTNSFAGAATTLQYGIDYRLGTLVTIANNAGTLNTVGTLKIGGVDLGAISSYIGFDIFGLDNAAYVLLDGDTAPTLYSLNLGTGDLTSITPVGTGGVPGNVYSLAVTSAPAVVPEAGTLPLLLGGLLTAGAGVVARRRSKK